MSSCTYELHMSMGWLGTLIWLVIFALRRLVEELLVQPASLTNLWLFVAQVSNGLRCPFLSTIFRTVQYCHDLFPINIVLPPPKSFGMALLKPLDRRKCSNVHGPWFVDHRVHPMAHTTFSMDYWTCSMVHSTCYRLTERVLCLTAHVLWYAVRPPDVRC